MASGKYRYHWFYFRLSWYMTLPPLILHFLGYFTPDWVYINDCEKRGLFYSCRTSSCCIDNNGWCGGLSYVNNSACSNGEKYCENNSTGCSVDEPYMDKIVFNLQTGALFFQFLYFFLYAFMCMGIYALMNEDNKNEQRTVFEIVGQYMGLCFLPFMSLFCCCCCESKDFDDLGWFGRIIFSLIGVLHILPGILILAGCSQLVVLFPGNTFGYSYYLSIASLIFYFLMAVFGTILAYFLYTDEDKVQHFCRCQIVKDREQNDQNPNQKEKKKPQKRNFFKIAKIMTKEDNKGTHKF